MRRLPLRLVAAAAAACEGVEGGRERKEAGGGRSGSQAGRGPHGAPGAAVNTQRRPGRSICSMGREACCRCCFRFSVMSLSPSPPVTVQTFSEVIVDQRVHFLLYKYPQARFLWVGGADPTLSHARLAVPSPLQVCSIVSRDLPSATSLAWPVGLAGSLCDIDSG